MHPQPIIFLAFASQNFHPQEICPDLSSEKKAICQAIRPWNVDRVKDGSYGNTSELIDSLHSYKDRIGIFHFAGHAKGNNLVFADASQKNDALHIKNLANFLKNESYLALVFLNACATAPMVQYLLDQGIKAIIATDKEISDTEACDFAKYFYNALAQGCTLQEAFTSARSTILGREFADEHIFTSDQLSVEEDHFSWDLYHSSDQKAILDWQLSHLDALPPITQADIKDPQELILAALQQALRGKTVIGVTGHRDLLPEDTGYMRRQEGRLEKRVGQKLEQLKKEHGEKLVLLSPLAQGADQLVAWTAMQQNIPVYAILPMALKFYEDDFGDKTKTKEQNQDLTFFHYLLGQSQGHCVTSVLEEEKTGAARDQQYEAVGKFVAQKSDVLLALWDGVETAKTGGTSEIVKMVCTGLDRQGRIFYRKDNMQVWHLLTPRLQNRFPLRSRFNDYNYNATNISVKYGWETLPLNPVDLSKHRPKRSSKFFKIADDFFKAPYFWQLVLPLMLALVTLTFGTIGFYEYHQKASEKDSGVIAISGYNAFYKAAGLLILGTSVIERQPQLAPCTLEIARVTGVLFIVLAFVLAFIYNFREQLTLLKIALRARLNKKFVLVCGLGWRGQSIVSDLRKQGIWVIVVEKNADHVYKSFCSYVGAKLVIGDANSAAMLEKVRFYKASEIYLVTDTDATNIAIFQKIDQWFTRHPNHERKEKLSCFIHIDDYRQRSFLDKTLQNKSKLWLRPFKVFETTARQMATRYPVDRFYQDSRADTAQLIIFGFSALAEELILAHLRLGHFVEGKKLRIRVFTPDPEKHQAAFEAAYPCTVRNKGVFKNPVPACIQEYVFFQDTKDERIVDFQPLPLSDVALLNEEAIYDPIRGSHVVNLYVCLDDGFQSTTLLSTLLPKLESLRKDRKCDLQVFCYSHRPDGQHHSAEKNLYRLSTTLPVHFFGNFDEHRATAAIKAEEQDQLARFLDLWYYLLYDRKLYPLEEQIRRDLESNPKLSKNLNDSKHESLIEKKIELIKPIWEPAYLPFLNKWADIRWVTITETDKESNRQAADHMGFKMREIGYQIRRSDEQESLSPDKFSDIIKGPSIKSLLSKMEHQRWCAEKLLDGFLPFEQEPENWKKNKEYYKEIKRHKCLKLFSDLGEEQEKDLSQLIAIPYLLYTVHKGLSTIK